LRQEDKITNFSRARKQHVDQKSTLCHADNSCNNVFASFKSRVSNP
jgi:hypothetical protein